MTDRISILEKLVNYSKPLEQISIDLNQYEWDFEGHPLIINTEQVLSILNRYISGNISSEEIENWANLIECREDLDFEKCKKNELERIIYRLANPALEGDIDINVCSNLIDSIS